MCVSGVCVCVCAVVLPMPRKHNGSKGNCSKMLHKCFQDISSSHNGRPNMRRCDINKWDLLICDVGIVGSYFTYRLGSLLRFSPRYWGVMKRGWQERCILPPCPTIFWFYLFSTISNTLNPCYSGGREVHSMKIDTLAH